MTETSTQPAPATVTVNEGDDERWGHVMGLSCRLSVEIPIPGFKIGDLVGLRPQGVVDTRWQAGTDVPVQVNRQLVGWCEFEVVENRLAVRITELA